MDDFLIFCCALYFSDTRWDPA